MNPTLAGVMLAAIVIGLVFRFARHSEVKPGPIRRTKSGAPMDYR